MVFLERDERLRPELGARVLFAENESAPAAPSETTEAVLVVQNDAVVRMDGADQVFVLERDTVHLRRVTLGEERGGRRVVASGLSEGESVVVAPPADLKDGQRVRVQR